MIVNIKNIKTFITVLVLASNSYTLMDVFDKACNANNITSSGRNNANIIIIIILIGRWTLGGYYFFLLIIYAHCAIQVKTKLRNFSMFRKLPTDSTEIYFSYCFVAHSAGMERIMRCENLLHLRSL